MTKAITVAGLHKSFGRTHALDGLDLDVETGEVHGFLGPNGAGKSTTIRVLLGLLRADSGAAQLLGRDPWTDAVELHRRVAYVPGDVTLWRNLSGGEVIDLYGRLRGGGLDKAAARRPHRAVRARPHQEGAHVLQGQPAEGRPGRRLRLRRRPADPGRADLRPRPADGGGLPGLRARRPPATAARPYCSPRTSSARSRTLCDRVSIIRKGRHGRDRLPRRAAPSDPYQRHRRTGRPPERARRSCPASTTSTSRAGGSSSRWTPTSSTPYCVRSPTSGVRSLTSTPPTLEELFLRHYQDDAAPVAEEAMSR